MLHINQDLLNQSIFAIIASKLNNTMEKDKPKFTRLMKRKLKSMNHTQWTHEEAKKFLGVDCTIRDMRYYMDTIDMTFDWKIKMWRHDKPQSNPYERTFAILARMKEELGLKQSVHELMYGTHGIARKHVSC